MCKHCTKCHAFAWWDGDYCCTMRMSIMESSPDGKFWSPLPEAFNAENCKDYDERSNYDSDPHDYYNRYIDFLIDYYELPDIDCSKDNIIKELGYKKYK